MEQYPIPSRVELNMQVTDQILKAQHLEASGVSGADYESAWLLVSETEEAIAAHPDVTEVERNIAIRGAVEAATKSGNTERVSLLKDKFSLF